MVSGELDRFQYEPQFPVQMVAKGTIRWNDHLLQIFIPFPMSFQVLAFLQQDFQELAFHHQSVEIDLSQKY
jgi:hypothetical protein